ncbi:uncharacterized protein MONBRDRAFT_36307 [Monosiga brevicollis MX1]|uniref:Pecanex C-terminal domain-containing protein n=1 Tax=Monosiga brevicollis TaxID=81824 RepID=A9UUT0_MONBE|nr:uncharacterized protein MONBRDRAFT_36307 [Monosiga brevicollis MX1]EDQ90959.1 predicted protein [Monosiga brevicollis MX1]|eukprot:XP_001744256.1 hypothetical protein [Monosiga brevicollis MX1]
MVLNRVVVCFLCGLVVGLAHLGLLVGDVPACNQTRPTQGLLNIDITSRALHASILAVTLIALAAVDASAQWASDAAFGVLVLFIVLPLIWWWGIFPLASDLGLWCLEQVDVYALGGASHVSASRSLWRVLAGVSSALVGFAIMGANESGPNVADALTWSIFPALALAIDARMWRACLHAIRPQHQRVKPSSGDTAIPFGDEQAHAPASAPLAAPAFLLGRVVVWLVALALAISLAHADLAQSSAAWDNLRLAFALVGLVVCVLASLLAAAQQPLVLGWLANPIYKEVLYLDPCTSFGRYGLNLLSYGMALLLLLIFKGGADQLMSDCFVTSHPQVIIVLFVDRYAAWGPLVALAYPVQLLLVSLLLDRVLKFVDLVRFMAVTTVTHWRIKPMRLRQSPVLIAWNVIALPLNLGLAGLAALLDASVMPLFGLPFFVLASPRSRRFWQHVGGQSDAQEAVYYSEICSTVADALITAYRRGALGHCRMGEVLLLRFENRMMMVHLLEAGLFHAVFLVQGLELTETSCHTTEATHLEEVLDYVLPEKKRGLGMWKPLTPQGLVGLYNGALPHSVNRAKLPSKVKQLVVRASRLAIKLALDLAVVGDETVQDLEELAADLRALDRDVHLGRSEDALWYRAIRERKQQLFALAIEEQVVQSHLVTSGHVRVRAVRLNAEAVRGQWANMALELLFLTNDDEERYSIQAHRSLLRNLTLQSAEPPLGYPVFSQVMAAS